MRQARSYFNSVTDADAAIKPLLLYYGALGLARGLILFTGHKVREANLDQKHGLTAKGWASELAKEGGGIESLTISLDTSGTFRELVTAVSNQTLVSFNSSAVQWSCVHEPFKEEAMNIRFGDLIRRMPAVASFTQRWLQLLPCFVAVHSITSSAPLILKIICPEADRGCLSAIFGAFSWAIIDSDATFVNVKVTSEAVRPYIWSDRQGPFGIGTAYLTADFNNVQICQIAAVFVAAYTLGMLARYHPSHWTALIRNEKHDAALPTIQALIGYIEEHFPAMVLDFLKKKEPSSTQYNEVRYFGNMGQFCQIPQTIAVPPRCEDVVWGASKRKTYVRTIRPVIAGQSHSS